jgi:ElaB/YqjD/DUF883 family membrane-anchored ribosome-binding protein
VSEVNSLEIVLQEIRAMRTQASSEILGIRQDMAAWRQQYGERLAEAEKSIKVGIDGNGTPSRLRVVEMAVDVLQGFRWKTVGAAAAVGALLGSAVTLGGQILVILIHK